MSRLILELRTYCHNKALFFTNCMDFSQDTVRYSFTQVCTQYWPGCRQQLPYRNSVRSIIKKRWGVFFSWPVTSHVSDEPEWNTEHIQPRSVSLSLTPSPCPWVTLSWTAVPQQHIWPLGTTCCLTFPSSVPLADPDPQGSRLYNVSPVLCYLVAFPILSQFLVWTPPPPPNLSHSMLIL